MGAATATAALPQEDLEDEDNLLDTAEYLRRLLTSEQAFQAAFQPTWRVAAHSEDVADHAVYSETVARVCSHFDPKADTSGLLSNDSRLTLTRSEAWSMLAAALTSVVQNLEARHARVASGSTAHAPLGSPREFLDESKTEMQLPFHRAGEFPEVRRGNEARNIDEIREVRRSNETSNLSSSETQNERSFSDQHGRLRQPNMESSALVDRLLADLRKSQEKNAERRGVLEAEEKVFQKQAERIRLLRQRVDALKALEVDTIGTHAGSSTKKGVVVTPAWSLGPAALEAVPMKVDCTSQPSTGASNTTGSTTTSLEGPMSLEDVKQHVYVVNSLRWRINELETQLDMREDEVASLHEAIRRHEEGERPSHMKRPKS